TTSIVSPGAKPRPSSPAANDKTISRSPRQVISCQMPLLFSRIAARSGNTSALRARHRISVVSSEKSQVWLGEGAASAGGMRASDIGLDHARIGDDIRRLAGADHRAVVQRQHPVADAGDDIHMMLDEQ